MKHLYLLVVISILISCKEENKEAKPISDYPQKISTGDTIVEEDSIYVEDEENKYYISYEENEEILELLTLLPDSVTPESNWKTTERESFRNTIKENGYVLDTILFPKGFSIMYNEINIHLNEDESWNFYSYNNDYNSEVQDYFLFIDKIKKIEHSYFKPEYSDEIIAYRYKDDTLKTFDFRNSIQTKLKEILQNNNIDEYLKTNPSDEESDSLALDYFLCDMVFRESQYPLFEYIFANPTITVELGSDYYIERSSFCLKGNYVIFKYIKDLERFEVIQSGWKSYTN